MKVTLGNSNKKFEVKSDSLTIDDVMLMVAEQFGEEWYGCCVVNGDDFICNAVKDYYSSLDSRKTVYEWAIHTYVNNLKIKNGFCSQREDYNGDIIFTTKNAFSEIQ